MAMVRWDPFSEMMTVQRDMNRLFSSLGMPLYTSKGDGERVAWMPTVDVVRRGDDLVVRAELPGVKPQDIDVALTDDVLTIKGKREEKAEYKEGDYIRKESSFGSFERQIMLPQGVGTQDISAGYGDGILEVTVKNAARTGQPQTQHIPVSGMQGQPQVTEGRAQRHEVPVGGRTEEGGPKY
ncbi:MAG TPA: Hsp20/alpha crystallin family protein [Coriobacteriia bacterium]|jgi:HSP20 family protein